MSPRTIAKVIAAGRIGFGVVLVAAPGALARRWVGADGETAGAQVMATGLGARDLALGGGVLTSLANGTGARPWLVGSAAADLGDLLATLRHRRELPGTSVLTLVALAGGSAAVGAWLSAQDDW